MYPECSGGGERRGTDAGLPESFENWHSQEELPGITPENAAGQSAQRADCTPENAKPLARYAGHLDNSSLRATPREPISARSARGSMARCLAPPRAARARGAREVAAAAEVSGELTGADQDADAGWRHDDADRLSA